MAIGSIGLLVVPVMDNKLHSRYPLKSWKIPEIHVKGRKERQQYLHTI
jgi:hypothetical protein